MKQQRSRNLEKRFKGPNISLKIEVSKKTKILKKSK